MDKEWVVSAGAARSTSMSGSTLDADGHWLTWFDQSPAGGFAGQFRCLGFAPPGSPSALRDLPASGYDEARFPAILSLSPCPLYRLLAINRSPQVGLMGERARSDSDICRTFVQPVRTVSRPWSSPGRYAREDHLVTYFGSCSASGSGRCWGLLSSSGPPTSSRSQRQVLEPIRIRLTAGAVLEWVVRELVRERQTLRT